MAERRTSGSGKGSPRFSRQGGGRGLLKRFSFAGGFSMPGSARGSGEEPGQSGPDDGRAGNDAGETSGGHEGTEGHGQGGAPSAERGRKAPRGPGADA